MKRDTSRYLVTGEVRTITQCYLKRNKNLKLGKELDSMYTHFDTVPGFLLLFDVESTVHKFTSFSYELGVSKIYLRSYYNMRQWHTILLLQCGNLHFGQNIWLENNWTTLSQRRPAARKKRLIFYFQAIGGKLQRLAPPLNERLE